MMNILIIGAGKLGIALANTLKHQHTITLVSRSHKPIDGVHQLIKNAKDLTANDFHMAFDVVFIIISPDARTPADYYRTYVATAQPICESLTNITNNKNPHLFYISSSRVYAESPEQLITSDTTPRPNDELAKLIYASELIYQGLLSHRVSVVRLTGLTDFCPLTALHQNAWLAKRAMTATRIDEWHWLNLVHRDFVIKYLVNLLENIDNLQPVYVVNQLSAPRHQIYNQIRTTKGLEALDTRHLTDEFTANHAKNLSVTGKRIATIDY